MANVIYDFSEGDHISHYLLRGDGDFYSIKVSDMETEVTMRFSRDQIRYFLQNLIDENAFIVKHLNDGYPYVAVAISDKK
ncbi:hypothetical protein GCM10023310_70460 [Paenibacillus vulneris]|uniref:KTSC domain-containing protein n=1 Tax=Paenibacillus vulneris TaxID=1133364 RepID=A0ABW3UG72_9BACL